jgi:hypothetical protein
MGLVFGSKRFLIFFLPLCLCLFSVTTRADVASITLDGTACDRAGLEWVMEKRMKLIMFDRDDSFRRTFVDFVFEKLIFPQSSPEMSKIWKLMSRKGVALDLAITQAYPGISSQDRFIYGQKFKRLAILQYLIESFEGRNIGPKTFLRTGKRLIDNIKESGSPIDPLDVFAKKYDAYREMGENITASTAYAAHDVRNAWDNEGDPERIAWDEQDYGMFERDRIMREQSTRRRAFAADVPDAEDFIKKHEGLFENWLDVRRDILVCFRQLGTKSKRIAFSERLGIEVRARLNDDGRAWCGNHVILDIEAEESDFFDSEDFKKLAPSLGGLFGKECPIARSANLNGMAADGDNLVF